MCVPSSDFARNLRDPTPSFGVNVKTSTLNGFIEPQTSAETAFCAFLRK